MPVINETDWHLLEILDYLSDIVIVLDQDRNILAANPKAQEYFCLHKDALIGKSYFEICQSQGLTAIRDFTAKQISQNHFNDTIEWKIISQQLLIGKIVRPSRDEVFLSSILNANYSGLHIYWVDTENRIIHCNDTQARSVGYQFPEQLRGKTIHEIVAGINKNIQGADDICRNNKLVMEMGKSILFEEHFEPINSEQDSKIWCYSYKAPFYDKNGRCLGVIGISTDITERKILEKELVKAKYYTDLYMESILQSSPNNIYWVDNFGRVINCNDQQAICIGLKDRSQLIGKTILDVGEMLGWEPEMAKQLYDNNEQVKNSGQTSINEEKVILMGKEHIFLASKSPMFDTEGNTIGLMGMGTDITELKYVTQELEISKQKAEAANRYKTQFITYLSHDIRTPLVGIHGIASWLLEKVPAEFIPEINALIKANNELLHLLNNVIHLTKLELNEIKDKKEETFDLYQLIVNLTQLLSPIVSQKKLSLNMTYPENLPKKFISTSYSVQQIILNLITNALKFTQQGEISIRIARDDMVISPPDIFPLLIAVEDTGIGIPKSKFNQIFESFQRLNPSFQNNYYGSGLGLSIVRECVHNLGGRVWLESEIGKGSCFFVSLPLKISHVEPVSLKIDDHFINQVTTLQKQQPLSIHQNLTKPLSLRILLVEDNTLIQKGIVVLLNKLNCYVDIAGDAKSALVLTARDTYDLIFMDIGLPDEDGFWTTQQIKKSFPNNAATPIIALTAHLDLEYKDLCQQAGMNDIVIKPLTMEILLKCLKTYGLAERVAV